MLTYIFIFIAGILFYIFVLPLIQQIGDVLITLLELWKSNMALKINRNNYEMSKLSTCEDIEKTNIRAIGFCPDENQEDNEELED